MDVQQNLAESFVLINSGRWRDGNWICLTPRLKWPIFGFPREIVWRLCPVPGKGGTAFGSINSIEYVSLGPTKVPRT